MPRYYQINKGILKPLEFQGLRAQYIAFAIAGFVVAFILYMIIAFVNSTIAIVVAVIVGLTSIGLSIYLNEKFGTDGLSKRMAQNGCSKYINNNKRIYKIINHESTI